MDGFDDLLAPSRDALANPFEDPFAKPRSNSPDPWSSFAHDSQDTFPEAETTDFLGARSATPTLETQPYGVAAGFQTYEPPDPLDSAASLATDEPETPSSPVSARSPGFRESISTIDEVVSPEERQPSVEAASPPPQDTPVSSVPPSSASRFVSADTSTGSVGHSSQVSSASIASLSAPKPERPFHTPLDQQSPSVFERSIAGLSIGGESIGGWQGSQSAFVGADRAANFSHDRSDSDDDDDRPIMESIRARSKDRIPSLGPSAPQSAPHTDNGLQPVFVISVDDPQRVGDPIRAYTMYTVHTKTTSPLFSKSSFSVLRRYSDFLWLYETLSQNNPGVVVPPVPEKNPFGRFDQSFVQQRRLALEKCAQKIANHPVLQKDPDLRMFLESDTFALDIKHRKAEIAQERGGLMASLGQTIAGPRFYETDEWFDKQKAYLDSLEAQLRGLVKAIDLVTKHRAELAAATGEFAQTAADLSAADVGAQLASSFVGLAEVGRTAQDLQNAQSQEDVVTIMSTVDEYARLINSVRLAFSARVRTYHAWQSADNNAKRIKQQHESNRAQGRLPTDQLSRSLSVIADAERRAMDAKQEFEQVSRLVKSEVARFEQERIEDFKSSLEAFLEGMISRQKQLISAWESYQQTLLTRVAPATQRPPENSAIAVV
ncbi:Vps5-domain-containing protein [Amylocystis lapponica]|nr:Vps5-domain-containing protein [Amylocystis lapponica]